MDATETKSTDISKTLFRFTDHPGDNWTIDDATKGTSIIGGTGAGKTSASGRKLALSFLKEGWGGLVLCAKTDEAELWKEYCKKAGRTDDLIIVHRGMQIEEDGKRVPAVFNPIDYEMKRDGEGAGETQNITNIFMNIYRMGNRIAGDGDVREERFWDAALKRCLNRTIELIKLAGEDLSYINMVRVMSTYKDINRDKIAEYHAVLRRGGELKAMELAENFCVKCIIQAGKNIAGITKDFVADPEKVYSYKMVEDYFADTLQTMDDKTTSIVIESFMGLAEPFLSGLLHEHFSGATNIFPEWTYEANKIIVLNLPIKEFLDAGIIAQSVFKLMFQQALERRNTSEYPTPVFLWADEAQYFINAYDQLFLTTARSSRTATVFLSQNLSNYYAVMGKDSGPKVNSLMGNLCTKIFHANSDSTTNKYASALIGDELSTLTANSEQHAAFSLVNSYSQNITTQFLPQVQPKEFTVLKTGGKLNNYTVQAIVAVSGKEWANKKNFLRVSFIQDFSNP